MSLVPVLYKTVVDTKINQTWTNQNMRGLWWPSHLSARAHTLQQDGPLEERMERMGNIENQLILKFHVY